ncbi:MAG: S8 family serine peptidase [Bdellovibrionales bacterium]
MRLLIGSLILFGLLFVTRHWNPSTQQHYLNSDRYLSPFEFHKDKILLSSDLSKEDWIKKGTVLVAQVAEDCKQVQLESSQQTGEYIDLKTRPAYRLPGSIPFTLNRKMQISELRRLIDSSSCILGIGDQQTFYPSSYISSDPFFKSQVYLQEIGDPETMAEVGSLLNENLVVAVIDTGIDLDHPDLKSNIWINEREKNGLAGIDDDGNGYTDDIYGYNFSSRVSSPEHQSYNDHGTHVAGLVAAVSENKIGIRAAFGNKVKVMALNVYGKYSGALTSDIDEAIYYAIENGAHVINISAGSPGASTTTAAAIAEALNHNVLVVVSAGNLKFNVDRKEFFPAMYAKNYPGLISVAATDIQSGKLCEQSNYGVESIKIAAPGCDSSQVSKGLFSLRSNARYGYKKGTSMAAPLVAVQYGLFSLLNVQPLESKDLYPKWLEENFLSGNLHDSELEDKVSYGAKLFFGSYID